MERFFPRISPLKRPSTSLDVTVSTVSPSDTEPTSSKRNRVYKYSLQWENQRPWLSFDGKRMFCSYCVKHSKSSSSSNNRFVVGCESLRLDNIRAHEMSMLHKNNHTTYINLLKPPAEQPIIKAAMNLEKHDIELMKNLFITAFYIAKHEKPFTDFVNLNELKERIYGSETGCQHYNSDKQAKTFVNYIARSERDILLQNINNSEVIAVAIDGATDSANLEQELFYVTYLDENFQPRETYLKIVNVKGRATAEGLCECFFETFEALGIDVRSKCVQLATDGPSVMKNLCVRVRSKISWLLQFHCINHRLELAVKDAVKDIPLQSEVHSLLDGLHQFYNNSNLQLRMLQGTAKLLDVKLLTHPTAMGTHWVAHQERAVVAMERNYRATVTQLHECQADTTQRTETRAKALGLRDKLLNPDIVTFMFAVLKIVLVTVSCLSCVLQSNHVSIDTVINTIRNAKTKLNTFSCENNIAKFRNDNITNGLFKEIQLKNKISRNLDPTTDQVLKQGNKFVSNLQQTMLQRFGPLDDGNIGENPEISMFAVFDTCNLPTNEIEDNILAYGEQEINNLADHFKLLMSSLGYDAEQVTEERVPLWRYVISVLKTTNPEGKTVKKFWPKILRRKSSSPEFKNILFLVKILLVIIFSTSCVERGFSLMNREKSDWRAKLGEDTLDDLMLLSLSKTTVAQFDTEPAIKLWWLNANKPRRQMLMDHARNRYCNCIVLQICFYDC